VREIDRGVKWALEQHVAGQPVLVHCAHGHGRSLVLMCAILVVNGQVSLAAVGYFSGAC
jgi:protein-tyrosine phosphatase